MPARFKRATGHERPVHFAWQRCLQVRAWPRAPRQRKVVTHADVAAIADVLCRCVISRAL